MGNVLAFARPASSLTPVLSVRERVQLYVHLAAVVACLAIVPRLVTQTGGARFPGGGVGPAPAVSATVLANPPPDRTPTGGVLDLAALRGRIVLLDFWATWCGPCNVTSPILDGFAKAHAAEGVTVLGLSQDSEPDDVLRWLERHRVSYVVAHDPGAAAGRAFGVTNLPTLVVIDREGNIRARRVGVTQRAELERLLAAVR